MQRVGKKSNQSREWAKFLNLRHNDSWKLKNLRGRKKPKLMFYENPCGISIFTVPEHQRYVERVGRIAMSMEKENERFITAGSIRAIDWWDDDADMYSWAHIDAKLLFRIIMPNWEFGFDVYRLVVVHGCLLECQ